MKFKSFDDVNWISGEVKRDGAIHVLKEGNQRICRNCEYYDDGTGSKRIGEIGDCLNNLSPRFQTKPDDTCKNFYEAT